MTPETFLAEVAHPNMLATFEDSDDVRTIVNAILSLDALVGMIHTQGVAAGQPGIAEYVEDRDYREALAEASPSYRMLRDAAATLKHGALSAPKKTGLARLLRTSEAFAVEANTLGFMEAGDRIGGEVILIRYDHDEKQGIVRASRVITDTYRMLKRIVAGGRAETDDHDAGTFCLMGGPPGRDNASP